MIKVKKCKKNKISPVTTQIKRLPRPSVSPMQYKPCEHESDHVVIEVKADVVDVKANVDLKF